MQDIKYYDLFLQLETLDNIQQYELQEPYYFCFYEKGMEKDWVHIQLDAKQIKDEKEGYAIFEKTFMPYQNELHKRMIFIKDENHQSVGTITAHFLDYEDKELAKLHWVALCESCQGKKMGKPLLSKALHSMKELGYSKCMLHTQTTTWIAVNMYLDFNFMPLRYKEHKEGWIIMKQLINHKNLDFIK